MNFLAILFFTNVAFALNLKPMKQSDIMPYIYDGRNAMPGDAPWQVSLRDALVHWNHSCGGSILSVEWIVTSGYCGDPYTAMPESVKIRYDTLMLNEGGLTANVLNVTANPAELPLQDFDPPDFEWFNITGWGGYNGLPYNESLQIGEVQVFNRQQCADSFRGNLTLRQFCGFGYGEGKNVHLTLGDQGGPAANKSVLIGISLKPDPGRLDIFTNVGMFVEWTQIIEICIF
ncbi:hypothetical protein BLOT_015127 [Blomia tropicalis]|nr:hypothetical protein BLOT_015127 [Blomia tropicalis]